MAKEYKKKDIIKHKDNSIKSLRQYFNYLLDEKVYNLGKADKVAYWIEDYTKYLLMEDKKKGCKYRKYNRGDVIKLNLGFNVGNEYGGLHYAIVLDKNDSINSGALTIVPLTSIKPKTDVEHLPLGRVNLGNEIFNSVQVKRKNLLSVIDPRIAQLRGKLENIPNLTKEEIKEINDELDALDKQMEELKKIRKEVERMKQGSIAIINQITTISKLRIYNPKKNIDALHGIKISTASLDKIDEKMRELFLK